MILKNKTKSMMYVSKELSISINLQSQTKLIKFKITIK